ncbi:MAG: hypothetical protein ACLQVM_11795 [Terriglobia bacterium]
MPSLNQLHVDEALTQISIAYRNQAFVAEDVMPVVPVMKKNDVFFKFSKQHFRSYKDAYAAGQRAQQIEVDLDARGFYMADGHALEDSITDDEREQADPGAQLEVEKTEKLTNIIALNEEIAFFSNVVNTTVISQNANLQSTPTSQWSDYVNSDPVAEVLKQRRAVQQQIGDFPNTMLISQPVLDTLANHPRILDRVKYTANGARNQLDEQDLARVFKVDKVLVSAALYQQSPEGEADNLGYIMGKNAMLFYRPPRPGIRVPTFGYTFFWAKRSGVLRWRELSLESDFIRVKKFYAQQVVAANAAYLWLNATT